MSVVGEVRYPESDCVQCGRRLPAGALECEACFPAAPRVDPAGPREVERHLRRSRARLLVGTIWFPPILPLAYRSAMAAAAASRDRGIDDPALRRRIDRHASWAVIGILLWLALLSIPIFT